MTDELAIDLKAKAVIFDCDGVLVDSEKHSCYALNVLFERLFGVDIGTDYSQVLGKSVKDGFQYYLSKHELTYDGNMEVLYREKEQVYQDLVRGSLQAFPGVVDLIESLLSRGTLVAVGSSGSHEKIAFSLSQACLDSYFEVVVSSADVPRGKPFPDLFLRSSDLLGVDPSHCAVIEDSVSGVQAAKAAGMMAVGVTNSFPRAVLEEAGADIVVGSLEEFLPLSL